MRKDWMSKRLGWPLAALCVLGWQLHAGEYQVIERDFHSKTFQRQDLDEAGQIVTHQYFELETGMHYFDQG